MVDRNAETDQRPHVWAGTLQYKLGNFGCFFQIWLRTTPIDWITEHGSGTHKEL